MNCDDGVISINNHNVIDNIYGNVSPTLTGTSHRVFHLPSSADVPWAHTVEPETNQKRSSPGGPSIHVRMHTDEIKLNVHAYLCWYITPRGTGDTPSIDDKVRLRAHIVTKNVVVLIDFSYDEYNNTIRVVRVATLLTGKRTPLDSNSFMIFIDHEYFKRNMLSISREPQRTLTQADRSSWTGSLNYWKRRFWYQ